MTTNFKKDSAIRHLKNSASLHLRNMRRACGICLGSNGGPIQRDYYYFVSFLKVMEKKKG